MRVVLDTNVLVSALLSPDGPPARALALIATRRVDLLVDDRILAEYEQVLRRPKFSMEPRTVSELLQQLEALAEYVPPAPCPATLPDPGDLKFLECASAGLADCIVTGNPRHFPRKACRGVGVVTPAQFVSMYLDSQLEE